MSISRSKFLLLGILLVLAASPVFAQRDISGATEIKLALDRLDTVGSVLMIAAHPDDENTAVLAYFARGRHLRTGYLSLTRGEGGQNLIGSEQGDKLGIIRTEELLAARRIDGAQQFFSRAIDFGFTKTADETFQKWGRDQVLGDVVWVIRKFRPDVILLRFSGTPRDGHGQHQASAILGKEAFTAAADPARYPEQLKFVQPWQAKRILWNAFAFTREQERELESAAQRITIDPGEYDPLLGYSYGEIAGMSRSMHRSQGMGAPERKGVMRQFFTVVAGEPATSDPFDGVSISWKRLVGGEEVAAILDRVVREFDPEHPVKSIPALLEARPLIAAVKDPAASGKLAELDETIAMCAGLWLDVNAQPREIVPGGKVRLDVTAVNRSKETIRLNHVDWSGSSGRQMASIAVNAGLAYNEPLTKRVEWTVDSATPYSQPYWLELPKRGDSYAIPDQRLVGSPENPPILEARFQVSINGQPIEIVRTVRNRSIDRVLGEMTRPIAIVPPVAINMTEQALVFPDQKSKIVEVPIRAAGAARSGVVRVAGPPGWRVTPERREFDLTEPGQQTIASFEATPPAGESLGQLHATAEVGGREVTVGTDIIDYPHIPPQALFPPAASHVTHADIRILAKRIGYIMGAGDEIPRSLRQIGCEVTLLTADDLARRDLSGFDAIVTGVRAWNVRPDLKSNRRRLFDYVNAGGTLVVQYNVLEGGPGFGGDPTTLQMIGPYPIKISHDRVTVEEAPVTFPNPSNPVLHAPNEITARDFEGWIQERGLYFASEWDSHYQSLLESHDPEDKPQPLPGGALFTRYGKGAYIFTGYSFFRELPAGVPGAFRVFANFLSAGKVLGNAH